jgi:hypothetical protein
MADINDDDRGDLERAVAHALQFEGRRRTHHADRLMAEIAAKKIVAHLLLCGFVIRKGAGVQHHSAPPSNV